MSETEQKYTVTSGNDSTSLIVNSPEPKEAVVHPSHYNQGKIEVIDFIMDQKLDFPTGNSVKYICRARWKSPEKEVEDYKKAIEYLQFKIKDIESITTNNQ